MERTTRFGWLLAALVLGACDTQRSPTAPEPPEVPEAPAPPLPEPARLQMERLLPAAHDLSARVTPLAPAEARGTGVYPRLQQHLADLQRSMELRDAAATVSSAAGAREALAQCADDCLVAQERSVIELTLYHVGLLIQSLDR